MDRGCLCPTVRNSCGGGRFDGSDPGQENAHENRYWEKIMKVPPAARLRESRATKKLEG